MCIRDSSWTVANFVLICVLKRFRKFIWKYIALPASLPSGIKQAVSTPRRRQCARPSNTRFFGSTLIIIANDRSIGFCMAGYIFSIYPVRYKAPPHFLNSPSPRGSEPHLIHSSLAHLTHHPKRQLDRVRRFAQYTHLITDRQRQLLWAWACPRFLERTPPGSSTNILTVCLRNTCKYEITSKFLYQV